MVETPDGEVYHTHLCVAAAARPRRSPLGRETAIQKCVWGDDGWLRLDARRPVPRSRGAGAARRCRDHAAADRAALQFRRQGLPHGFPVAAHARARAHLLSLTERPAAAPVSAARSIGSWFEQALVARRQEHFSFRAETGLALQPRKPIQQAAGLTHYYNRHKFHFLGLSLDGRLGTVLTIMCCPGDWPDGRLSFPARPAESPLPATDRGSGGRGRRAGLQFFRQRRRRMDSIGHRCSTPA